MFQVYYDGIYLRLSVASILISLRFDIHVCVHIAAKWRPLLEFTEEKRQHFVKKYWIFTNKKKIT